MRLAALAALAACAGSAPPPAAPPKQAAVDESKAEKDAKGLLNEIYQTIDHADTDGLMPLLVDPLIVFGPRRADALPNRSDALVALKALVDPKNKRSLVRSGTVAVVPSPGGHSAWAFDVVEVAGQRLAITAVLTNADDEWQVVAAALARTPSMREVRAELKKAAVVPPGMAGIKKIDPNASSAVDRFTRGFAEQQAWGDDLGSRTDAIVIGPSVGDVTRGKAEIKKLWKKRLKGNVRLAAAGEVTAALTADGQLAWVTAPVVKFADDDEPLPLREFAVFEKSGADWKLIALHESLALDEPGTGAELAKIAAPAGPKAEPPPAAKPADDKKPKKHRKKPKPKSDD
jgi:ketosteroid isomerase-like protein